MWLILSSGAMLVGSGSNNLPLVADNLTDEGVKGLYWITNTQWIKGLLNIREIIRYQSIWFLYNYMRRILWKVLHIFFFFFFFKKQDFTHVFLMKGINNYFIRYGRSFIALHPLPLHLTWSIPFPDGNFYPTQMPCFN